MKTIKWEKCVQGSIGNHPAKNGKMLTPTDPVEPDMHVTAKYKGSDVHLRIKKEIQPKIFNAGVMFFEPISTKEPDDLFQNDEVLINRSYICCIYAKE